MLRNAIALWREEDREFSAYRELAHVPWEPHDPFERTAFLSEDETTLWCLIEKEQLVAFDPASLALKKAVPLRDMPRWIGDEWDGWSLLPVGRMAMKRGNAVCSIDPREGSSTVFVQGRDISKATQWCTDPAGRIAWASTRSLGRSPTLTILDLGTLQRYEATHPEDIDRVEAWPESDGSTTLIALDTAGRLTLWNTRHENKLDALDVPPTESGDTYAMSFDGKHVYLLRKGSDDQYTWLHAVACDRKRFGEVWETQAFRDNELRGVTAAFASAGALIVASQKHGDRLLLLTDILRRIRQGGNGLNDDRVYLAVDEHAAGWSSFLRAPDGPVVYAYNGSLGKIAAIDLRSGEMTTLAEGLQVTTWHIAGRYICVASNFRSFVALVDRYTGRTRPIVAGTSIAMASAWGPDAQNVEVWSLHQNTQTLRFRRASEIGP